MLFYIESQRVLFKMSNNNKQNRPFSNLFLSNNDINNNQRRSIFIRFKNLFYKRPDLIRNNSNISLEIFNNSQITNNNQAIKKCTRSKTELKTSQEVQNYTKNIKNRIIKDFTNKANCMKKDKRNTPNHDLNESKMTIWYRIKELDNYYQTLGTSIASFYF